MDPLSQHKESFSLPPLPPLLFPRFPSWLLSSLLSSLPILLSVCLSATGHAFPFSSSVRLMKGNEWALLLSKRDCLRVLDTIVLIRSLFCPPPPPPLGFGPLPRSHGPLRGSPSRPCPLAAVRRRCGEVDRGELEKARTEEEEEERALSRVSVLSIHRSSSSLSSLRSPPPRFFDVWTNGRGEVRSRLRPLHI